MTELEKHHLDLVPDAQRALIAVEDYGKWLEDNKGKMTAHAGIGIENYNWWLKNVWLIPTTWEKLMDTMEHEYERAIALLKLEQHKNRGIPQLEPVSNEAELRGLHDKCQQHLFTFIREKKIFTVPEYLVPIEPRPWTVSEVQGSREFIQQCRDRNPLPELCHNLLGQSLDGLRKQRDNRPIRGTRLLYSIAIVRSKGFSTGLEEIMMHLGLLDDFPRAREINYITMAFRAIRAIADLKLHSNEFTLLDANQYCYEKAPNKWMQEDSPEVWYEMQTTLRKPGWHMGIVFGKHQILQLLAEESNLQRDNFNLREFMDVFMEAGIIPISLIRWEMTSLDDEINELW